MIVFQTEAPFLWALDHLSIIGWPAVVFVCWKLRGVVDRFLSGVALSDIRLLETQKIAVEVKAGVDAIQSQHLFKMEKDMNGLSAQQDETNKLLTNIDKGIAILADRARV